MLTQNNNKSAWNDIVNQLDPDPNKVPDWVVGLFNDWGININPQQQQQQPQNPSDYINEIMKHWTISPAAKNAIAASTQASNNATAATGMQGSGEQLQQVQNIAQSITAKDQMNYLNHILELNEMKNRGQEGSGALQFGQQQFNQAMQDQEKQGIMNAIGGGAGLAYGAYNNWMTPQQAGAASYYPTPPSFGNG